MQIYASFDIDVQKDAKNGNDIFEENEEKEFNFEVSKTSTKTVLTFENAKKEQETKEMQYFFTRTEIRKVQKFWKFIIRV